MDVADAQEEIQNDLENPYYEPSGVLMLLADTSSIHTTPVGREQLLSEMRRTLMSETSTENLTSNLFPSDFHYYHRQTSC